MLLHVRISIDDGKGKKAEIEINETDNLSKLIIIQNVFNLFGIDTDVLEMTKTYQKVGEAYSSFFSQVEPIEVTKEAETKLNVNEIKEQLITGFTENKEVLDDTYKAVNDQPEYIRTGIKIREDGTKTYRLHYRCTACYNRGTHYIYEKSKTTWCHRCQHEFIVYPAHPDGFPTQDNFGNFFRAGEFKDWNAWS